MHRLLIVRTDAIGDAILWNGALPGLRRAFPDARVAVACREAAAAIYETAPEVDEIIPLDFAAISGDPRDAAAQLSAWEADLLLHPTRSRERHTEGLITRVRAGRKVALASDLANATGEELATFDAGYDELIQTQREEACELDRHADVLRHFGVRAIVRPRVLLTDPDRQAAEALLAGKFSYAVLAPSARWPIKHYPAWAEALIGAWSDSSHPSALVAVGGTDAAGPAAAILSKIGAAIPGLRTINLTDGPNLRTTYAVIAGATLCIGNDTFTAHAAAALGVASVTIVGGGHFGRFLPYDPSAVVATMPLSCGGCHWRCHHARAYCIKDLPPDIVAHAIRLAGLAPAKRPRVVIPASTPVFAGGSVGAVLPAWIRSRVEIVPVQSSVLPTVTR